MRLNFLLLLAALLFSVTAHAEEAKPVSYSPPYCSFTVQFPSEPYKTRRCEDGDNCYDQISYTKVYDMESTVNFRVICNPVSAETYEYYNEEIMRATLRAMTKRSVVETFDMSYRAAEEGYKQAGLVGEGQSGKLSTIYIAQIWADKNSMLSVEAEMIGPVHEKADQLLRDVLKSVHFLSPEEIAAKKDPPEEKPAKEKKEEEKKESEKEE